MAAKRAARILEEAGVLHRGRADDDVPQPGVDVALDGVQVADAAAQLHRNVGAHLGQDGLDGRLVLGLAGKRAVQVHQVQAARARIRPLAGHGGGVFAKGGRLVHVTLLEAYAVAVLEVDGGDEQHDGERGMGRAAQGPALPG